MFWEIVQQGQKTISAFGKLGSAGSTDSQVHSALHAATKFVERKVKEKIKKGYKERGKAKVCPAFLQPKYSHDFVQVEGTITQATNITPGKSGMAYECEAQTACLARRDCPGYFKHKGYFEGYPTYHLLGPGTVTWNKGSHSGWVVSVRVKRESANAAAATTTSDRAAGRGAKKQAVMKVLKKPATTKTSDRAAGHGAKKQAVMKVLKKPAKR
ncbi:Eif3a [Symbiodinium natans]|uniref:Eif3a protein n=1 Tax=Symbiodinium natans TaxID=878477 RepID=A0A812RUW3_9DINO|nr:Eif3a [Symbiodinium natans]